MLERIVSGGQTGVDRGALDAALALGFPCGGWCPAGRLAEDGPIPERYPVVELAGADYRARTRQNVRDADGTLILAQSLRAMPPGVPCVSSEKTRSAYSTLPDRARAAGRARATTPRGW